VLSHCSQQRCDGFIEGLAIQDNNLIRDVDIREVLAGFPRSFKRLGEFSK